MDNTLLFDFREFTGINNKSPQYRLPIASVDKAGMNHASDVVAIENMDIDDTHAIKTRPGSVLKLSGADIHSAWSDGKVCLFVEGTTLCMLNEDYSKTTLLTGLAKGLHMSYQPVNDRIYMTNGSYIGYYSAGTVHGLSDPGINYKVPLPAGQRISYFKGSLYVASGNVMYISDALCDHYDIRTGYRVFEDSITMMRAVDSGIYVADGKTWFLAHIDGGLRKDKVLDIDAVPHTDIEVNGSDIKGGVPGNYAVWVSKEGIQIGDPSGKVVSATSASYHLGDYVIGGAVLRELNGSNHYIVTLR